MTRLLKKLKLKRFVAMLLLVATVLPFFSSATAQKVYAASSANTIQKAYIAMMKGMQTTDSDIAALASMEDLQLLSLFMSNAYIPFLSCLDGENSEESMEVQIEFLVSLGFDKETAEQVTRQSYGASLQSARPLYIDWNDIPNADGEKTNSWGDTEVLDHKIGAGVNSSGKDDISIICSTINNSDYQRAVRDNDLNDDYTPFTFFMFWYLLETQRSSLDNEKGETDDWAELELPLYYKGDDGSWVECFELNTQTWNLIVLMLNSVKSYKDADGAPLGNALFLNEPYDGSKTDGSVAVSEIAMFTNAIVFQNIYVDWVGNIIVDCGSSRRVLFPACLNPYAITNISGDKNNINAVSAPFMSYSTLGDIDDDNIEFENYNLQITIPFYMDSTMSSSLKWDSSGWFWSTGDAGSFGELLAGYGINYDDGVNDVNDPTFTIRNKDYIDVGGANKSNEEGYVFNIDENKKENKKKTVDYEFDADNTLADIVVYKDTMSSADMSGSTIISENMWNNASGYFGAYFNSFSSGFRSDVDTLQLSGFNPNTDVKMLQSIYLTYIYAYCNSETTETTYNSATHVVDMKFNKIFPTVDGTLTWEIVDTMDDKIKSLVYYLLHPTEGVEYVATMVKNKLSGFFINWHEDMVGGTDSNYTTGMTQYLGFTGYTTVPNLNDVSWLANILSMYNSIIVYFLIIMCIILLCYVLVGNLSLQRGVIGLFMFGVLAFLPPIAITAAVDATNTTSEAIYATKFDYWALNQTEGYLAELSRLESFDMTSESGVSDYISYLLSKNSVASSGEGGSAESSYAGVKVKWLSPKKASENARLANELNDRITSSNTGLTTFTTMVMTNSASKTSAKEIFVSSDSATYLYRDYMDIYRYASTAYNVGNYFTFPKDSNVTFAETPVFLQYTAADSWTGAPRAFWRANSRLDGKVEDSHGEIIIADNTPAVDLITMGSGDKLSDYVTANFASILSVPGGSGTYKSFQNDVADGIVETSSLYAISRGFLTNTTSETDLSMVLGQNYFGDNQKAAGLLLGNSYCVELNARNLELLKYYARVGNLSYGRTVFSQVGVPAGSSLSTQGSVYFGIPVALFTKGIEEFVTEGYNSGITNALTEQKWETYYYGLYTESPFYYFNFNIRDQISSLQPSYFYNYKKLNNSSGNLTDLFVEDNQQYFFNLTDTAGDGYGELRDFMNMHDLFYYVIPCLRQGNEIVNLYDSLFGMSYDENSKLIFTAEGSITYQLQDGTILNTPTLLQNNFDNMTEEEKYDFWHNYNVRTIFNSYTPWLNLMYACDYTEQENITVMGEKYLVTDPLDPSTYFKLDDSGNMIDGRYMVFSRSEMAYYGLSWEDLTTVERKIITIQDNVYKNSLDLMNYYTYSDETLIQAYAMLQLFEFNKEFSQTSLVSEGYVLYPQSYELKAFTYDAYLRMILSNAGGDELQVAQQSDSTNLSIYTRIMEKTSIFFGIILIINDFISVYLLPALKLFFICFIFILSIMMVIASATKMEFNMMKVVWKSLLAPLLSFSGVSIALAFLVSLFMSDGASGVTRTNSSTISLGDPTMTLIVMLVLNVIVLIIYFKICKKLWKDFVTYTKAIADNIGSAVTGAVGKMVGAVAAGKSRRNLAKIARNTSAAGTARQRGMDNSPHSGKSGLGLGGALAGGALGGAVGGAVAGAVDNMNEGKGSPLGAVANKYSAKASGSAGIHSGANSANDGVSRDARGINNDLLDKQKAMDKAADRLSSRGKLTGTQAKNAHEMASRTMDNAKSAFKNGNLLTGVGLTGKAAATKMKGVGLSAKSGVQRGVGATADKGRQIGNSVVSTAKGAATSAVSAVKNSAVGKAYTKNRQNAKAMKGKQASLERKSNAALQKQLATQRSQIRREALQKQTSLNPKIAQSSNNAKRNNLRPSFA